MGNVVIAGASFQRSWIAALDLRHQVQPNHVAIFAPSTDHPHSTPAPAQADRESIWPPPIQLCSTTLAGTRLWTSRYLSIFAIATLETRSITPGGTPAGSGSSASYWPKETGQHRRTPLCNAFQSRTPTFTVWTRCVYIEQLSCFFKVRVYRLISAATLEERIFLRARKKLLLNQLVIKSGGDVSATENDDAVLGIRVSV